MNNKTTVFTIYCIVAYAVIVYVMQQDPKLAGISASKVIIMILSPIIFPAMLVMGIYYMITDKKNETIQQ